MRLSSWILPLMLVVSGCSQEPRQQTATTTSTIPSSTTAEASASAPPPSAATSVVLHGGGLSAFKDWPFGSDATLVTADLGRAFGMAPKTETMDCEAGATELRTWPAMTALIQEGKLVGWSTRTSSDLQTDRGIGLGSRRSDLLAAYPEVEVAESSLGTEWSVEDGGRGFLVGLLDGEAPSAAVAAMWSGNACVFR